MTYVQMVEKLGSDLGLQLNCSKLELICEDMITREAVLRAAPGVHVLSHDDADILGSRIRSMKHAGGVIQERSVQLHLMGDRLCLPQSHNALFLAFFPSPRYCTSSKLPHVSFFPHIEAYDSLLRSLLSHFTNVILSDNSMWLLPARVGGICIQRAAHLSSSAFLASAAGCSKLVHQILLPQLQHVPNSIIEFALTTWHHGRDELLPSDTDRRPGMHLRFEPCMMPFWMLLLTSILELAS